MKLNVKLSKKEATLQDRLTEDVNDLLSGATLDDEGRILDIPNVGVVRRIGRVRILWLRKKR